MKGAAAKRREVKVKVQVRGAAASLLVNGKAAPRTMRMKWRRLRGALNRIEITTWLVLH